MRTNRMMFALAAIISTFTLTGCSSVRTDAEDAMTLGVWIVPQEHHHRLVATVLHEHGVAATADARGVTIKQDDYVRAMEALLMDERLEPTNLMLFACVQAGTGRRTENGVVATVNMPAADDQDDACQRE